MMRGGRKGRATHRTNGAQEESFGKAKMEQVGAPIEGKRKKCQQRGKRGLPATSNFRGEKKKPPQRRKKKGDDRSSCKKIHFMPERTSIPQKRKKNPTTKQQGGRSKKRVNRLGGGVANPTAITYVRQKKRKAVRGQGKKEKRGKGKERWRQTSFFMPEKKTGFIGTNSSFPPEGAHPSGKKERGREVVSLKKRGKKLRRSAEGTGQRG